VRRVIVVVGVVMLAGVTSAGAASARSVERARWRVTPVVLHLRFRKVATEVSSIASDRRYVAVISRASGTFLTDEQTG